MGCCLLGHLLHVLPAILVPSLIDQSLRKPPRVRYETNLFAVLPFFCNMPKYEATIKSLVWTQAVALISIVYLVPTVVVIWSLFMYSWHHSHHRIRLFYKIVEAQRLRKAKTLEPTIKVSILSLRRNLDSLQFSPSRVSFLLITAEQNCAGFENSAAGKRL